MDLEATENSMKYRFLKVADALQTFVIKATLLTNSLDAGWQLTHPKSLSNYKKERSFKNVSLIRVLKYVTIDVCCYSYFFCCF